MINRTAFILISKKMNWRSCQSPPKSKKKTKTKEPKKLYPSSSSIGPFETSLSANKDSFILNMSKMVTYHKEHKEKSAEPQLSVLQTVKKHYAFEVDQKTHGLPKPSSQYEETVSSYIV